MTLDEAIKHCEEVAEENEKKARKLNDGTMSTRIKCEECASEHRQLAEWLKELEVYREFADWLVKAVLEEDWEEDAGFYAEVLCRKLTKLGKLKVVDNKYMEVKADED
jgi:hypothetical protein